jgi:hypothetical protein
MACTSAPPILRRNLATRGGTKSHPDRDLNRPFHETKPTFRQPLAFSAAFVPSIRSRHLAAHQRHQACTQGGTSTVQFIDLKQHFVNRLPSVQPLCLQYVAVTFHGAAQSVSMEACLVARCCTVRVSTSCRMLVQFISFFCVQRDADRHRQHGEQHGAMSASFSTVLHSPCQWRPVSLHGAAQSVPVQAFACLCISLDFCVGTDWSMHRLKMKTNG